MNKRQIINIQGTWYVFTDGPFSTREGAERALLGTAFNDPTMPCCGRDAADCDCENVALPAAP